LRRSLVVGQIAQDDDRIATADGNLLRHALRFFLLTTLDDNRRTLFRQHLSDRLADAAGYCP
jgi:hypothetical protein